MRRLLVAPLVLLLDACTGGATPDASGAVHPGVFDCPARTTPATPGDAVPHGAIAVRICPAEDDVSKPDWQPPFDAVISGMDDLADLVNERPVDDSEMCPMVGGIA